MPISTAPIQFERLNAKEGHLGLITLNRTPQFNALNQEMILSLFHQLLKWRDDADIQAIIIQAAPGKAFCAGGDLKIVYDYLNDPEKIKAFFRQEYSLDLLIHEYPKPYISFLNGITMGGGAGISILGSHRIVTENTVFAMPETGIGFFSDAGTTYHLSKIQNHLGIYLALTGAHIDAATCLELGLADAYIPSEHLPNLIHEFCQQSLQPDPYHRIARIIQALSKPISSEKTLLKDEIPKNAFAQTSVEAILNHLSTSHSQFHQDIILTLKNKSPLSLKANLKILQEATFSDFKTCINREFRLASRLSILGDFKEGIRSQMIDKDKCPRWNPSTLEEIPEKQIADLLAPFENPDEELIS